MTLKARPFCDRQVGELRECTNRRRNTWFPAPRSPSALTSGPQPSAAPTGWRSLGTQERTKWVFPASVETPESTTGKPSPSPPRANPATTGPPPPPPGFAPPRPRSRPCRAPARSQPQWRPPGAQLGPTPTYSHRNLHPRSRSLPRPGAVPARFQPQWPLPRALLGLLPTPSRPENGPAPPGFAPPLPRSRYISSRSGDPGEHNWDRFPPPPDRKPAPRRPVSPRPCHAPGTLPISSVHARIGAGCRSVGDVSGA